MPANRIKLISVHCFVAGTLVKTEDGDAAIETIQAGGVDVHYIYDPATNMYFDFKIAQ